MMHPWFFPLKDLRLDTSGSEAHFYVPFRIFILEFLFAYETRINRRKFIFYATVSRIPVKVLDRIAIFLPRILRFHGRGRDHEGSWKGTDAATTGCLRINCDRSRGHISSRCAFRRTTWNFLVGSRSEERATTKSLATHRPYTDVFLENVSQRAEIQPCITVRVTSSVPKLTNKLVYKIHARIWKFVTFREWRWRDFHNIFLKLQYYVSEEIAKFFIIDRELFIVHRKIIYIYVYIFLNFFKS